MTRGKRAATADDLLQALAAKFGHVVDVGVDFTGELDDGELVAEVHVTIRKRVSSIDRKLYEHQVLDYLRARPYAATRCSRSTSKKFLGRRGDCHGTVTGAIVVESLYEPAPTIFCVCSTHKRGGHNLDPKRILGIVDLSPEQLAPFHAQAENDRIAWQRKSDPTKHAYERPDPSPAAAAAGWALGSSPCKHCGELEGVHCNCDPMSGDDHATTCPAWAATRLDRRGR